MKDKKLTHLATIQRFYDKAEAVVKAGMTCIADYSIPSGQRRWTCRISVELP